MSPKEAFVAVLTERIDANIERGQFYGYRQCCIEWFSFVWEPLFVLYAFVMKDINTLDTEIRPRIVGRDGTDNRAFGSGILCPRCRRDGKSSCKETEEMVAA